LPGARADEADIEREIARAGEERTAVQHDALEPGTSAVAVAVRVAPDRDMSIDVVLPSSRLTADAVEPLLRHARAAAARIESVAMTVGPDAEGQAAWTSN
jgi:DNA-binding IclR family transcriptional regulator